MTDWKKAWSELGQDVLRGLGGGAIVGMPLLFTMEMWEYGRSISDWLLLSLLLLALAANTLLNRVSGFGEERGLVSYVYHSVIAVGLAALFSFVVLLLFGDITRDTSLAMIVRVIALESVPVSIGISVANTSFTGRSDEGRASDDESAQQDFHQRLRVDLTDAGYAAAGALVFSMNIAVTEEVVLITSRTNGFHWAGLIVFSLLLTYSMVFVADFVGRGKRSKHTGFLQRPIPETLMAYGISVAVGLLLVMLIGRYELFSSPGVLVGTAAVIGLPASVGGAAGRLII